MNATPSTVLYVDDDALISMNAVDLLQDLGYHVLAAHSGLEALTMLQKHPAIEALITDQTMPGMTGTELARQAREMKPGLPILLVTGHADMSGHADAQLPHLAKPYYQDQLATALRSLLPQA